MKKISIDDRKKSTSEFFENVSGCKIDIDDRIGFLRSFRKGDTIFISVHPGDEQLNDPGESCSYIWDTNKKNLQSRICEILEEV